MFCKNVHVFYFIITDIKKLYGKQYEYFCSQNVSKYTITNTFKL